MLVLTRKPNQTIHIGETVNLQVLEIQGSRVKIGISCPQEVKILRGEISVAKSPAPGSHGEGCDEVCDK